MSKHLPGRENEHAIVTSGIDFSADSLLRQQPGSRTGSAIQWVGPGTQSGSGLPVSALLRQLCASRESVIRANVQVRKGNQDSGICQEIRFLNSLASLNRRQLLLRSLLLAAGVPTTPT
jgi:hypothetical protein